MSEINFRKRGTKWEYRFEGAKIDGKRNQISKGGFRTKKEAEDAGIKALAEYNNAGLRFEPSEISVSDFLDYWLKNYVKVNCADSTYAGYKNIIENHIKPRLGYYKLKSVSTLILQEQINDIYLNRGFTNSFMKNILKVLKGSFKYAKVTAKLISSNPAMDVEIPKRDTFDQKEDGKKIIVLTKNQVSSILTRFEKSKYQYCAMLTAYYTGLRVSEVYGLTWDCIDFENKTLKVNKIAKKIEKEGKVSETKRKRGTRGKATTKWYLGTCKTPSSYRTISIGDTLIQALKDYKDWQESNKKEYDDLYTLQYLKPETSETGRKVQRILSYDATLETPLDKADLIFVKENGEFHGTDSIKYVSKVVNYELGIEFNFHAFRHTHATMLIEAGIPVNSVAERLGHSNTRTTLDTYVHVTDNMRTDAVEKFESFGDLTNKKVVSMREFKIAK